MALISELVAPVEEAPPPEETPVEAPPVEVAPPPPQGNIAAVSDTAPVSSADSGVTPPEEVPPPEPGPFESAVRGVQGAIGGAVAPLAEQLPEPVQNLADIVGQPVGGAIDTVTNVTGELGQGNLPGAALAALEPAMAPQARMREQAGTRVADGLPVAPQDEFLEDPGSALAILPSLVLGTGLASAGGQTIDDWAAANPDVVQQANEAGGGNAVVDAYLESLDASPAPPPELVNPLDAAGGGNPLERAAGIAGAIPEFLGSYVESGKEGTLTPFLKNQLIEAAMDPLSFVPPAVGARVAGAGGRVGRAGLSRVPAVGRMLEKTPEAQATIAMENANVAAGEIMASRAAQAVPPPAGATDAGVTPGPLLPSAGNGPPGTSPDMGQPAGTVPPPPRWQDRPHAFGPETGPQTLDQLAAARGARIAPPEERPAAARTIPPVRATRRGTQTPPETPGQETLRSPTTGDPIDAPITTPAATPSRVALGLRGSRWVDTEGRNLVEGTGQRATIRPEFRDQVEAVYRDMFDAPPEQFYEAYQARFFDPDVTPSDQGILARYRGAMTQGLYMLDDWPAERVARELDATPGVVGSTGTVNWNRVESLMNSGTNEVTRLTAKRAYAGKRAHDLSTHRIATAADPDLEVRNHLLIYHLDQVSGRFDGPQHNTAYWRDRAASLRDAMTGAGYMPTAEALAALRSLDLATEARTAFPDLPEYRLRALAGKNAFVPDQYGGTIVLHAPGGQVIPITTVAGEGLPTPLLDEGITPAAIPDEAVTPAGVGEYDLDLTPPAIPTVEQARRQAAVQAAYANAPPPLREAVAAEVDPDISRYGVIISKQTKDDLALPADGAFKFKDGYRPKGMTKDDVLHQLMADMEFWANVEDVGSWRDTRSATKMRRWEELNRRFDPDGTIDRETLRGPVNDQARQVARDELTFRIFREAQEAALPTSAPKSRLGKINQAYMGVVRRNMLYNYLRVPSYILQNQITNTINIATRAGLRPVLDYWTKPKDIGRTFKALRAAQKEGSYDTFWASLEKQMGMGHKPNIPMTHPDYLNKNAGKLPRGIERISKLAAPDILQAAATIPDRLARETVATAVVMKGYRKLNRAMPARVRERMRKVGAGETPLGIPDAKVDQVVHDFFAQNRTVTDANAGTPYRGMTGRAAKYESVWNPEDFGKYLKQHLREDMQFAPDTAVFNRAIDRIVRDSKNDIRGILDEAERKVDSALFDWRNTNADQMLGKVFFFHYWMSRQGGLYVTEMLKRPGIMASYGRMMEEFERQAEELGQPSWLKGFFQMQNSVAGFSIWTSPFDLVQSLLTFADWQYGNDEQGFKDLTGLGKAWGQSPFLIHPALQFVAYELGLLGPDYYAPPVTGLETFGARAIDLLNLGNAQDAGFMAPFNAMGIGVDEAGNKVPIPVRPLQELYARWGNAISTALAPITGLSPVEVSSMSGSAERNIASIMETQYRRNHPGVDQMQVNRDVTELMADHGSEEYQTALRIASEMPFAGHAGLPGVLQGASRIASPFRVYNWPEQYNLDRWNLTDSGYAPPRNIPGLGEVDPATGELTPAGEQAKFILDESKYGATSTVEGRRLTEMRNEFYQLTPPDMGDARSAATTGALRGSTEPVTIGGVEYAPETLADMSGGDLYDLGTQLLADRGYSREQIQESYDAEARFLADNPDFAQYQAYRDLVGYTPEDQQRFVEETALTNPGFAQFVRSSLTDHTTGVIDYEGAKHPDAYLASQGVRPSVYSPVVGNEPSRVPGGYPSLAGGPEGGPLLPQATAVDGTWVYQSPTDKDYWAAEPVAVLSPNVPIQVLEVRDDGMAQVSAGTLADGSPIIGYVEQSLLNNASPPQPNAPAGAAPAPIQPTGGLAGLAGSVTGVLGAGKDAAGAVLGSMTGAPGQESKPAETSAGVAPGTYDVVPANDGIGEQSTKAGSDRTWMEFMLDGQAKVTTEYKGPPTANMTYQVGHGATADNHAAYDIGLEGGGGEGTPVKSPVSGTVVCSGYGEGTGGSLAGCTYSQNTTNPGSAHTVVIEVGRDQNGNPIQLSFNHMGASDLQPGQTIRVGDPIGTIGNTSGGPHIHLEGWLGDPVNGYTLVDPQLVVGGHYGAVDSVASQQPAPSTPTNGMGTPTLDWLGGLTGRYSANAIIDPDGNITYPEGDTMGTVENPADHYGDLPVSGGDWSVLDEFNDAYPAASELVYDETGVAPPPDLIKAMNAMESGFGRINPPTGVRNDVREKPLAGFVGVFKDAADSWGADFERMTTDPEYAIYGMALGLGRIANWDATQYGAPSGTVYDNYGWDGVMAIYYSGQPHLDEPQPADDTTTVRQYVENINAMRDDLLGVGLIPEPA